MRIVVQRVKEAQVKVDEKVVGKIDQGLLLLIGIEEEDAEDDLEWMCKKILGMRIFSDDEGKMNWSIQQVEGKILAISQFTLHASTKKGNRPSFVKAARPEKADKLYRDFIQKLEFAGAGKVEQGVFGAHMEVSLINDGPVTIVMDSKQKE